MALSAEELAAPAAGAPLVSLQAVGYEVRGAAPLVILQDISRAVREGEFLCAVGASGCGKTTLLRLIAGLLPVSRGALRFRGEIVTAPSQDRAIVFQDYTRALLPWRTIAGNVALALEARGTPRRTAPPLSSGGCARSICGNGATGFRRSFPAACSNDCRSRAVSRKSRTAADGRAVRRARRHDAPGPPRRGRPPVARQRHHGRVRHPRSRRGDLSRRPRGGDGKPARPHRDRGRDRPAAPAQPIDHA